MATTKGLVLVTGASGYIAARVVEAFLKAGYSVRGTTRSTKTTQGLTNALSEYADRLEIIEVPDITVPDAFADALKGVDAVAHLASPVSLFFTDPEPVIRTAKLGTIGILESAIKHPSVKKFVFMSSIVAITASAKENHVFTEADWNDSVEGVVASLGKKSLGPAIYSASKVAAERAFWQFRAKHKPNFTMAAINPTYVIGPPLVVPSDPLGNETNAVIWKVLSGADLDKAALPGVPAYTDVRDVARLVVSGIEQAGKANGERFIVFTGVVPSQAIADILRKAYPKRKHIIQEGTPGKGYDSGFGFPPGIGIENTKAVKFTGEHWMPLEKSILDAAKVFEAFF